MLIVKLAVAALTFRLAEELAAGTAAKGSPTSSHLRAWSELAERCWRERRGCRVHEAILEHADAVVTHHAHLLYLLTQHEVTQQTCKARKRFVSS